MRTGLLLGVVLVAMGVVAGCSGDAGSVRPGLLVAIALPTPDASPVVVSPRRALGTADPRRVEFDPSDDDRLLVMESNGDVQIWEIGEIGRPRRTGLIAADAIDVRYCADGRAIFVGGSSGAVSLWTARGTRLWRRDSGAESVRSVASGGDLLASGGGDGSILLWRYDGSLGFRRDAAHGGAVLSLAISPDRTMLVSEGGDTLLRSWKLDAAEPSIAALASLRPARDRVRKMLPNLIRWDVQWGWDRAIAFAPDGATFVASTFGGSLQLWTSATGTAEEITGVHGGHHVRAVAFAGDGRWIASAGFDGTVRVAAPTTGAVATVLRGHLRAVSSVAFDRRGRIASAGLDGTVRLWNLAGEQIGILPTGRPPKRRRGSLPRRGSPPPEPPGDRSAPP